MRRRRERRSWGGRETDRQTETETERETETLSAVSRSEVLKADIPQLVS